MSALEPLPINILTLWLSMHIAEDYELLHSTLTKCSRCTGSISTNSRTLYSNIGCAHTSCTHFNWIFETMSSLRCNYALYCGTMPLSENVHVHCNLSKCRHFIWAIYYAGGHTLPPIYIAYADWRHFSGL